MDKVKWSVSIYIEQSVKGLKRQNGIYGYAVEFITQTGKKIVKNGFKEVENVTAHEMEIIALTNALRILTKPCVATIHSAHGFVKLAMVNHWLEKWEKCNWINAHGKPVKNEETWKVLNAELKKHSIIVADTKRTEYQEKMQLEIEKRMERIR
ncbi:MAG: RNase H family protein [Flavobacterium sp.]